MTGFFRQLKNMPFIAWLIGGYAAVEVVLSRVPAALSWDGSVYVGMGKYLYSSGAFGLWETLRPVGLPVLLGAAWKAGFDPYRFGQYVAIAGACLCLYFAYRLGDALRPGAGNFAAVLVAMTPLFLTYASIPMTDIISTAFALASVNAALRTAGGRGYAAAGLYASLAFLFRFPHGLVFVVSGAVIVMREWRKFVAGDRRAALVSAGWYVLGFCVLTLMFFGANAVAYGDAFLPLRAGSAIIRNLPELYRQAPGFYVVSLLKANILAGCVLVTLGLALAARRLADARIRYGAVFLYLALYLAYFTRLPHKELRYSLAFLPMVLVVAGVGLSWAAWRLGGRKVALSVLIACSVWGAWSARTVARSFQKNDQIYDVVGTALGEYERRTGRVPAVLSAAPFPVAVSDARVPATLYDDWREVLIKYEANLAGLTHVLLDTCTLETVCRFDSGCTEGKAAALSRISSESRVAADGAAGRCRVTLYERI